MRPKKVTLQYIQVVILAGGLGTRLQSKVSDRNKVVADINGKPFLTYVLSRLETFGIQDVIICSGYLHQDLQTRLGQRFNSLNLTYSVETKPLGTAGALRHALPLLSGRTVIVLNGDSYCDLDYAMLTTQHQARSARVTLSAVWMEEVHCFGRLVIGPNDKIVEFKEKDRLPGSGYINAGIYALNPALLETVPAGATCSLEKDLFPSWARNKMIDTYYHPGHFIDIGTVGSYQAAQAYLKTACVSSAV